MKRRILSAPADWRSRAAIAAIRCGDSLLGATIAAHWRSFLAKRMRGREGSCVVELDVDSRINVDLADDYWIALLGLRYRYEPDFRRVLERLRSIEFDFIDCGANVGYWSVLLSGPALGPRRVVAVEPVERTFAALRENCALNRGRFRCVKAAVAEESGRRVALGLDPNRPEAARVIFDEAAASQSATTVSLDDLALREWGNIPAKAVIKLDVEGLEVAALKGAQHLLRADVLLYYEDHGQDQECRVTDYVLTALRWPVFFVPERSAAVPIKNTADALRVKKDINRGYNFFACRQTSSFFSVLNELGG